MFETMNYEIILKKMLDRVPDKMDKREGSIIYDALAPAAVELQNMYIDLDTVLSEAYASTAEGEYLERRTSEMGIQRKPSEKAVRKGYFYGESNVLIEIPVGSRFSIGSLNYEAIERLDTGIYKMECETAGAEGNESVGNLVPIEYISGLARAELGELIGAGVDEETDEKLLERYLLKVRQPTTSGNAYQYKQWALEVAGIGAAKVFPLWNGPGSVKVVIADSSQQPAPAALVSEAAGYIESVRPIGAAVTVLSAKGKEIHATAAVTLASGYSLQRVQDDFANVLTRYLADIAFDTTYVSHARIGTLLLAVEGILDYDTLLLNEKAVNISLDDEEIPTAGNVVLEVSK